MDIVDNSLGTDFAELEHWPNSAPFCPGQLGRSGRDAFRQLKPQKASTPAPRSNINSKDPRCGTWLDEDLGLNGEQGASLLSCTLSILFELGIKIETPRSDFKANFERRVECYLVNALRAHYFRATDRVAYKRGNNDYLGKERWQSGSSMRETMANLVEAGLIATEEGSWGGPEPTFGPGWSATFWLLPPLLEMAAAFGVNEQTVGKPVVSKSKLIRLRSQKDAERKARELPFCPTEETERWVTDLERYNQFADEHEVYTSLDVVGEAALVKAYNRKQGEHNRQPDITHPEYFDRHLVRIFNDGDTMPNFEHGGRLYGAWYQHVPKWLRPSITIDGRNTRELDYSGMSVRMIYHLQGEAYLEDPYVFGELEDYAVHKGWAKDHYRESIKKLVQAMLNNEDQDSQPEMVKLDESFSPKFTRTQVRDMILGKHDRIRDQFGTGIGKRLQRMDSDIALEVIVKLMDREVLCLPIHDGFRVEQANIEQLRSEMMEAYYKCLGFYPIIKPI